MVFRVRTQKVIATRLVERIKGGYELTPAGDNVLQDFYSDDTLLTLAAIREGLGVSYLPCFMGDADLALERWCEPDPAHNLDLWILLHPDLKRTARVLAFRNHMQRAIDAQAA